MMPADSCLPQNGFCLEAEEWLQRDHQNREPSHSSTLEEILGEENPGKDSISTSQTGQRNEIWTVVVNMTHLYSADPGAWCFALILLF